MKQLISPKDAKELRQRAGLSQAELAKRAGVQRAYISQFENGKMILDDVTLERLRDQLADVEAVNDDVIDDAGQARLCDGFLVPPAVGHEDVELWCQRIRDLEARFEAIASRSLPGGFFGGIDESKVEKLHLGLMLISAQILLAIKDLQGRDAFYAGDVGQDFVEMLMSTDDERKA